MLSKLQYISQGATAQEQLQNIREALNAGCKWIQLRFKQANDEELTSVAIKVKELCATNEAIFIINDHPHIAHAVDADGVHLGLQDTPVAAARALLGTSKIIGGTANTFAHVMQRHNEGCTYVGVGPFRFTTTKEKLSPILGLSGYQHIIAQMNQLGIELPLFAIGGIGLDDITDLIQTGVYGIAVSGLITQQENKKHIVQQINNALYAKALHSR